MPEAIKTKKTTRNTPEYRRALDAARARDRGICQRCGQAQNPEVHHIIPMRDGGTEQLENLITLCNGCHEEWEHVVALITEDGETSSFPFNHWLVRPPYRVLLHMFDYVTRELQNHSKEMTPEDQEDAEALLLPLHIWRSYRRDQRQHP